MRKPVTMDKPAGDVTVQDARDRRGDPGNWWTDSTCRRHPTQWWFAGGHRETMLAKGICATCDVRAPCLEFALARPELVGVWAATTPSDRAAMRRASARGPVVVGLVGDDESRADLDACVALDRFVRPERPLERAPEPGSVAVAESASWTRPEPAIASEPVPVPVTEADAEHERAAPRVGEPRAGHELLTPGEAARLLGVTPNTVTRWSRAGRMPAIQTMGGHRRFRRTEVERVLRAADGRL
jgi:excisionase family DNA binding protein